MSSHFFAYDQLRLLYKRLVLSMPDVFINCELVSHYINDVTL